MALRCKRENSTVEDRIEGCEDSGLVHSGKKGGATPLAQESIIKDDPWMIFVRDAGNEGDCSRDEHYLDRDSYTFFLPAPQGAKDNVALTSSPNKTSWMRSRSRSWTISNACKRHWSARHTGSTCYLRRLLRTMPASACEKSLTFAMSGPLTRYCTGRPTGGPTSSNLT